MHLLLEDIRKRMESPIELLVRELAGVRTGRASPALVEHLSVEAYGGGRYPLDQVASVSVSGAKGLTIQVWDQSVVKAVDKALRESDLNINPIVEGQVLRLSLPELSEERRRDLCKVVGKYAENTRVALRSIRREGMDKAKRMEKEKTCSEDEWKRLEHEIQKLTDAAIARVDALAGQKDKEIMTM